MAVRALRAEERLAGVRFAQRSLSAYALRGGAESEEVFLTAEKGDQGEDVFFFCLRFFGCFFFLFFFFSCFSVFSSFFLGFKERMVAVSFFRTFGQGEDGVFLVFFFKWGEAKA